MKILAIETSADDTGIAILDVKKTKSILKFKILANKIHTQVDIHTEFGGIFPMMAKREHIKNIGPVYESAMKEAKNPKIDAIAVTIGPGLEPALWVGIAFAEELAKKLSVPVIPVNHMEGHLLSVLVQKNKTFSFKKDTLRFPMLSLLVSGGHTELVLVKEFGKYRIIGQTRDDAVGEAFDKVARMLGLPYPGGPEISRLAKDEREVSGLRRLESATARSRGIFQQKNIRASQATNSSEITFPRPMIYSKDYDFSFSGLKTAVLYYIRDHGPLTEDMKSKIAKEFEDASIEVLTAKTMRAVKEYKIKTLIVGGGVSANTYLQKTLKSQMKKVSPKTKIHFPTKGLSTDNALMIAVAGYFQYKKEKISNRKLKADGNLSL
ncbi:MAG: tRNA (adenosine(37)-N6)-threonylcarbamoyltransferase complex transferase subunit TsaD [Patescibacteria group bacterium]